MGKRPRPHFLPGIGDGNVHDGNSNENNGDISRLRGNQDGKNNDENSGRHEQNHRPSNFYNRNDFSHRIDEIDGGDSADWKDSFNDHKTAIPVMDLNLDLDNMNGGIGIDINKSAASTGPWQVSAFAFLGILVVIAIVLHFVGYFVFFLLRSCNILKTFL